jgi:acyl-lipid Delta6-acetylenase / acyl-lipid (9-3)-desaturase
MSQKEFTLEEITKHKTADDLWLAIDGVVYDTTAFAPKHPGGVKILTSLGGTDCTDAFRQYHPKWVLEKYLKAIPQVGVVKNYKPSAMRKDLQDLDEQMERAGLYKTPVMSYVWYFSTLAALFSLMIGCVYYTNGNFWLQLLGAVFLGVFWQQLSFVGHDFGHNSVTPSSLTDYIGGVFVNSTYGVSAQWWKATHNVHHVVTNSVEYDPDVQYLPLFAINTNLLRTFFSHYHDKVFTFGKWQRMLLSVQHYLYFPVMALARFNLYAQSIIYLLTAPASDCRHRLSAIAATIFFFIWNAKIIMDLPDSGTRWAFLLISHAIAGIIHVQITLSHFSMNTYNGFQEETLRDPDHFVKNQIRGSMNIECDPSMDWFGGGLQFQIEHHLFSRLPRHNLRQARDQFINPFLKKHGIKPVSAPFFESIGMVMKNLSETAKRAWTMTDEEVQHLSILGALANAEG